MSLGSKAKKLLVSFLLSCTMLTPFLANKAQERPDNKYPGRINDTLTNVIVTTIDQSKEKVDTSLATVWESLQLLKNSETIMGPLLADFSRRENLYFCRGAFSEGEWDPKTYTSKLLPDIAVTIEKALKDLGYNGNDMSPVAATWEDARGLVTIGPLDDTSAIPVGETHEMVHALQRLTGVKNKSFSWPIWDYQACVLSYEAASSTAEKIMSLELQQDSIYGPWGFCIQKDRDGSWIVFATYESATKNGTPYAQALELAGRNAFYHQFELQWWLDSYNEIVLYQYLEALMHKQLKRQNQKDRYDFHTVRKTGYISPNFNLTAKVDSLPPDLFGTNKNMRMAFDWMNLKHIEQTAGTGAGAYKETLDKLKAEGNPYLNINPGMVYLTMQACDQRLRLISVMNHYASSKKNPPANDIKHPRGPRYGY